MQAQAALKNEFQPRNILVPGMSKRSVSIKNFHGSVKIGRTKTDGMLEFTSRGLVVAFNGGGDEPAHSPAFKDAFKLSREIIKAGGVILNGGRNTGIMQATGRAAGKMCLGVNFAAQVKKRKAHNYGKRLVVHPLTRLALLTWCAPVVVVYGGGLGTFHELINALVAIKNRALYDFDTPRIFIHKSWRKILNEQVKTRVLPRAYLEQIDFFSSGDEVRKKLLT